MSFWGVSVHMSRRLTWPLVAALAIPVLGTSVPAAAAGDTPAAAVESYAYPGAAQILQQQLVTLKSGDGNI
ncbi:hypothetical protein GCM10018781_60840 [Kitasatospora indigofera]|uniref:Uncharacterized protein n=1 Tax=Kitasatospora indigofera TaxID=67307 RepID=A0A919L1H9_9ACTN|nr:hypothetical protein GCM10018781_60840 [Kitasatospora indigofera]